MARNHFLFFFKRSFKTIETYLIASMKNNVWRNGINLSKMLMI